MSFSNKALGKPTGLLSGATMRGPALSRAQDERVLLVKLGVVFRKVNQRLPCCRISGITRQWLHDTRALTRKLVVQSARSRRTHYCRLAVDGSTPKEGPQAKISPAPVSSVCDHEPSQGLLRSSIVVSILPGHRGRLIRQATRPLFPKDCSGPEGICADCHRRPRLLCLD